MRRAPGSGSVYRRVFRAANGEQRHARTWTAEYRVAGRRVVEPTGTTSRAAAEAFLRQRLAGLDRGEIPQAAGATTTWDDLVALIRADYKRNGRRSGARLELSIRHLDSTFGGQRASQVTRERVDAYIARRLDEEQAARASVNRELAALRRMLRLAHRAGKVLVIPPIELLRESNARRGFFERAEFGRLCRALPRPLRPLAIVAYVTGWRMVSELLTREWRHVDLRAGWLRLEPGETKSGEGRQFPLTPALARALRAQRRATAESCAWVFHDGSGAALFYRAKGGLLPSQYLREAWLAACTRAGIDGRLRHDFRRTAARDLLRSGVPTPVVMAAVGWRSEALLRRYAIVDEGMLREAGAKRSRLR